MTSLGICPNCQGEVKLYQENDNGMIVHRGMCWNCGTTITELPHVDLPPDDYESERMRLHPDWYYVWLPKEGSYGLYRILGEGETETEALGRAVWFMDRLGWELDGGKWDYKDLLLRHHHETVEKTARIDWGIRSHIMSIRHVEDGEYKISRFFMESIDEAIHIFERDYSRPSQHAAWQLSDRYGWIICTSTPITVKEGRE